MTLQEAKYWAHDKTYGRQCNYCGDRDLRGTISMRSAILALIKASGPLECWDAAKANDLNGQFNGGEL